jgi:two-component system chemotaxis response regulator CheY
MPPNKIRALLVDDNPEFLDFAARYLAGDEGVEVVGAALSGAEALTLAEKLRPDLALVDLSMPGMNGLDVARLLKSRPDPPRVVLLTMYDNPEYIEAAGKMGADGFVTKAELDTRLLNVIHALFQEKRMMKNILVVDDSRTLRKMVIASLGGLKDLSFHEAASGLEAIEQLSLYPIHLMTLDLNMPDMHGMEVLRFAQSHERYRQIPVIVLTTKGDPASRNTALSSGAAGYLTKPFAPGVLAKKVADLLAGEKGA